MKLDMIGLKANSSPHSCRTKRAFTFGTPRARAVPWTSRRDIDPAGPPGRACLCPISLRCQTLPAPVSQPMVRARRPEEHSHRAQSSPSFTRNPQARSAVGDFPADIQAAFHDITTHVTANTALTWANTTSAVRSTRYRAGVVFAREMSSPLESCRRNLRQGVRGW
jgi:hypothetical protein